MKDNFEKIREVLRNSAKCKGEGCLVCEALKALDEIEEHYNYWYDIIYG